MSKAKHKLHNTETDNLISNLRGEVGEILHTWLLSRRLIKNIKIIRTSDPLNDFQKPEFITLYLLIDKLEDEIIARLSELAEIKIGQLTFYFAQEKLNNFHSEVEEFKNFIEKNRFRDRRNQAISHKTLPEKWTEHRTILIPSKKIGLGVALAVKLMWKLDKEILGPSAKYLWREVLKKRNSALYPIKVNYMLLPYMKLSTEIRKRVIKKEMEAGNLIWECISAKVDGDERTVIVCKKWGAILLDKNNALILDDYPLLELKEISFNSKNSEMENNVSL